MKRLAVVAALAVVANVLWPWRCPWCRRFFWGWNYGGHVTTCGREHVGSILYGPRP